MDLRKEHGLLLAVAVGVGIFSGLLTFSIYEDYRTKKNVEAAFTGLSEALQTAGDALEGELREGREISQMERAERDRQAKLQAQQQGSLRRSQRLRSETGQELYRVCNEWREAHQQFASYTTSEEMNESCGELEAYLKTGRRTTLSKSVRKSEIYREG